MHHIGILAYGSLIDQMGEEIESSMETTVECVETPFEAEFARSSRSRDCAPTLVPVDNGGAKVKAKILVLKDETTEEEAKDMLYRREIDCVSSGKRYPARCGQNDVRIKRCENFSNVEVVFYTYIRPDISPLTGEKLAELAIKSVRADAGKKCRDGISYLLSAKKNGTQTSLMQEYENEILSKTGTSDLEGAWKKIRAETETSST